MKISQHILLTLVIILNLQQLQACCNNNCNDNKCCNSNCCSKCQNQCSTSSCVNSCQSSCCSGCQNQCSTTQCASNANNCQRSSCQKDRDVETIEKYVQGNERVIYVPSGGASGGSSTNTLIANATSNNVINNENTINMTINVNSNVINHISNKGGSRGGKTNGKVVTVTVKVPVPVPVTVPSCKGCSTDRPPTTVTPPCEGTDCGRPCQGGGCVPQPNCCIIVIPCATQGCNPYHHTCQGCKGNYGYYPVNPCGGGCFRKGHWNRESCNSGQCISRKVDCSYCGNDYYKSFEGYSQCHGCFHNY